VPHACLARARRVPGACMHGVPLYVHGDLLGGRASLAMGANELQEGVNEL
jgi:hypothetical protein